MPPAAGQPGIAWLSGFVGQIVTWLPVTCGWYPRGSAQSARATVEAPSVAVDSAKAKTKGDRMEACIATGIPRGRARPSAIRRDALQIALSVVGVRWRDHRA
jgi:hypothetical protein